MADLLDALRPIVLRHCRRGQCDPMAACAAAVSDYQLGLLAAGVDLGPFDKIKAAGDCLRAWPAVHRDCMEELNCKLTP